MNKKGIGTEQVLKLILFLASAIVIIWVVITVNEKLQGPIKVEGLRTKVELAAANKDFLKGVSAPAEVFRCGTERVYWEEDDVPSVAKKISEEVIRVRDSYGVDKQIDFFSDWTSDALFDKINICYVCAIASNNELFDSSDDFVKILDTVVRTETFDESLGYYPLFYGYDTKNNEVLTGVRLFTTKSSLRIGPKDNLFIGHALSKFKEFGTFKPSSGASGGIFIMNADDLNEYCSDDYLFIDEYA